MKKKMLTVFAVIISISIALPAFAAEIPSGKVSDDQWQSISQYISDNKEELNHKAELLVTANYSGELPNVNGLSRDKSYIEYFLGEDICRSESSSFSEMSWINPRFVIQASEGLYCFFALRENVLVNTGMALLGNQKNVLDISAVRKEFIDRFGTDEIGFLLVPQFSDLSIAVANTPEGEYAYIVSGNFLEEYGLEHGFVSSEELLKKLRAYSFPEYGEGKGGGASLSTLRNRAVLGIGTVLFLLIIGGTGYYVMRKEE